MSQIRRSLQLLQEIQPHSRDEFIGNAYLTSTAERQLQIAIQSAIDVGQYVLSEMGVDVPEDYADVFAKLGQVGVLPTDLAACMVRVAGLHNVLGHFDTDANLDSVYRYIQGDLGDLETFINHIIFFLERSGEMKDSTGDKSG